MKSKLFDKSVILTPENKRFAEQYDKNQDTFSPVSGTRKPIMNKSGVSFDEHMETKEKEALDKAIERTKRIMEELPTQSCKEAYAKWLKQQDSGNDKDKTFSY